MLHRLWSARLPNGYWTTSEDHQRTLVARDGWQCLCQRRMGTIAEYHCVVEERSKLSGTQWTVDYMHAESSHCWIIRYTGTATSLSGSPETKPSVRRNAFPWITTRLSSFVPRRSVQTIMINQNMIKWLVPLLSKTDQLSDYTLGEFSLRLSIDLNLVFLLLCIEYGVALLMNLCLRSNGRKKCAEIAEQAITVLASLLTHPNDEVSTCW